MRVTIFGATGPTGLWACRLAIEAGHEVRAVSRRDAPLPVAPHERLTQVRADAQSGEEVAAAVAGADAVLSTLGAPYRRKPITVYSAGTKHIVDGMRAGAAGTRLIVVSSGLTYPPPPTGWFPDHVIYPLLRNVVGRTLYADMRAMEEYLQGVDDLDWTILRPARLVDADHVTRYHLDPHDPAFAITTRADLAAAMVDLADGDKSRGRVLAPSTDRADLR